MILYLLCFGFAAVGLCQLHAMWRLVNGPSIGDRVRALDTISINAMAAAVLLGICMGTRMYLDAAPFAF